MTEAAGRGVGASAMPSVAGSPTRALPDTSSEQQIAQVPISALADISFRTGPPSIRNENGQLVGFVFVDVTSEDIDGYVRHAAARVNEQVQFPAGYYIQWAGQFEYLKSAEKRLAVVVPFTLLIIFL